MSSQFTPNESLADLIPQWFEGGTTEQMLDEAFAQIRTLEKDLASARIVNHWDRMKKAENEADGLRATMEKIAPFIDAAFVATPDQASGERFDAVRAYRKALNYGDGG